MVKDGTSQGLKAAKAIVEMKEFYHEALPTTDSDIDAFAHKIEEALNGFLDDDTHKYHKGRLVPSIRKYMQERK